MRSVGAGVVPPMGGGEGTTGGLEAKPGEAPASTAQFADWRAIRQRCRESKYTRRRVWDRQGSGGIHGWCKVVEDAVVVVGEGDWSDDRCGQGRELSTSPPKSIPSSKA